jgi:hypothetical protein
VTSRDQFRIGDAERNKAAEMLSDHMAEGRLTQPEFDERLDVALKAKTAGELEPLFLDLPGPTPNLPAEVPTTPPQQSKQHAHDMMAKAKAKPEVAPLVDQKWIVALTVAVGVLWTSTALIYFGANYRHWWIFIIPIALSIMLGKLKGEKH